MSALSIEDIIDQAARDVTGNTGSTVYRHNLSLNRRTIEIAVRAACACEHRRLLAENKRLKSDKRSLQEDLAEQAQLIDALHE